MTETKPLIRALSLGWGIQSMCLAGMIALKEIPTVDLAIHSDTSHEAAGTYTHAAKYTPWLEERGVKVVTVKDSNTDLVRLDWGEQGSIQIPAFTVDAQGKKGQIRRQCTGNWKVMAIRRYLRTQLPAGKRPPAGAIEMVLGISLDEWQRMRTSDVAYVTNVYPLVDMRMTRTDCVDWLEAHSIDVPPRSACVFCPFHKMAHWKEMKRAGGSDWNRAVEADTSIRNKRAKDGAMQLFIHPGRRPLAEAVKLPEDQADAEMEDEMPCDSGTCWT